MGETIEKYEQFLGFWKYVDPRILELEDAKKRSAGLGLFSVQNTTKVRLTISLRFYSTKGEEGEVTMSFLPKFLLKIVKAVPTSEEEAGIMSIIIQRPYSQLEKELRSVFKGEKDVKIIVDRRFDERRASQQAVEVERRLAEQRQQNEELVKVVIST